MASTGSSQISIESGNLTKERGQKPHADPPGEVGKGEARYDGNQRLRGQWAASFKTE